MSPEVPTLCSSHGALVLPPLAHLVLRLMGSEWVEERWSPIRTTGVAVCPLPHLVTSDYGNSAQPCPRKCHDSPGGANTRHRHRILLATSPLCQFSFGLTVRIQSL